MRMSAAMHDRRDLLLGTSSTLESDVIDAARATSAAPSPARAPRRRVYREWWVLAGLAVLVWLAWDVSHRGWFKPGDDVGYWLGVAGGVMMMLLLLYPLRKRIRVMQKWGQPKAWLWGHMVLGIGGPLLILIHCNFQSGSLNAAAALYSMIVVAASGVIGRFLYVRVNRGLAAERQALELQRAQMAMDRRSVVRRLPSIEARLKHFDAVALKAADRAEGHWLRLVLVLPTQSWLSRVATQMQGRQALRTLARSQQWDAETLRRRRIRLRQEIVSYYVSVMRVALFAAWERLFALWHVAHVPFVFLLLVAGVIHVIAVHAY